MTDFFEIWRINLPIITDIMLIIQVLLLIIIMYDILMCLARIPCKNIRRAWKSTVFQEIRKDLFMFIEILVIFIMILWMLMYIKVWTSNPTIEFKINATIALDVILLIMWPAFIAIPKNYAICADGMYVQMKLHRWRDIKDIKHVAYKNSVIIKKWNPLHPAIVVPLENATEDYNLMIDQWETSKSRRALAIKMPIRSKVPITTKVQKPAEGYGNTLQTVKLKKKVKCKSKEEESQALVKAKPHPIRRKKTTKRKIKKKKAGSIENGYPSADDTHDMEEDLEFRGMLW